MALVLVAVSLAVFVGALVGLSSAMREVMGQGGFCASGGPYEIRPGRECSSATMWLSFGAVPLMLMAAPLLVIASGVVVGGYRASGVVGLLWAGLFGLLGYNFWDIGLDPPGGGGAVAGWVVPGALFWLMAAPGLLGLPLVLGAGGGRLQGLVTTTVQRRPRWVTSGDGAPASWFGALVVGVGVGVLLGRLLVQAVS